MLKTFFFISYYNGMATDSGVKFYYLDSTMHVMLHVIYVMYVMYVLMCLCAYVLGGVNPHHPFVREV